MITSVKALATEIAKREGKKTQARIGEIREIVGIVADLVVEEPNVLKTLVDSGLKREKRKKK